MRGLLFLAAFSVMAAQAAVTPSVDAQRLALDQCSTTWCKRPATGSPAATMLFMAGSVGLFVLRGKR